LAVFELVDDAVQLFYFEGLGSEAHLVLFDGFQGDVVFEPEGFEGI
jgi:hypothetical protein